MIDITDAAAQDALIRSIAIDAIADTETAAADRINQELQAAAPGTAPMVGAHWSSFAGQSPPSILRQELWRAT